MIFTRGDAAPLEFSDIDTAVSKAVMPYEHSIAFDVVPASCGFITKDREITSLGNDFGKEDVFSPTQFGQSASEQIDAWISNRYRMHFDPETGNFRPRQYHREYARYINATKLHEAFVPAVKDGPIDLHVGVKLFPAPEPDF